MKKIFTGLLLLSVSFTKAQESKNEFVVNANMGVSYPNGTPGMRLSDFNLGYFFTNNFSLGITGNHWNYTSKYNSTEQFDFASSTVERRSINFLGFFARYNFIPKNRFGFFLTLNNKFNWDKINYTRTYTVFGDTDTYTSKSKSKGYEVGLNPGIIYFFHPKFSAEIALGSISYRTTYQNSNDTNNKAIARESGFNTVFFTAGFNIGFSYYFGCKSKNSEQ